MYAVSHGYLRHHARDSSSVANDKAATRLMDCYEERSLTGAEYAAATRARKIEAWVPTSSSNPGIAHTSFVPHPDIAHPRQQFHVFAEPLACPA